MTHRITALVSSITILLWVMPLGSFIKPSQEKTACGGGRAFHMCSMGGSKVRPADPGPAKISFSNASSVDKTQRAVSGSAGNDFTILYGEVETSVPDAHLAEILFVLPKQNFFFIPDPIPKF